MKTKLFAALALTALAATARAQESAALTVHEWGTFTSLQDEAGRAIGGINTDDEPVPSFVHDVAEALLIPPTELPQTFSKGVAGCHPDVTMRLETPVVYFHAPAGVSATVDVHVGFQGGWLTQFYPQAAAVAPGVGGAWRFGHLTERTLGTLDWRGLRINAPGDGPETTERMWLSPRAVQASDVRTQDGEHERFLFYRGVGHLDAPLRITRSADGGTLSVSQTGNPVSVAGAVDQLWLVDIRPDGTAAYRTLRPGRRPIIRLDEQPLASTPADFPAEDYATTTVQRLRADLRAALVADGLFEDEADALLNTWEVSYFKSAGERLFFLVPQPWTDTVLPLSISGVTHVTRVMVGRIELVTPHQRELLARLAATPSKSENVSGILESLRPRPDGDYFAWNAVARGQKTLAQAGVAVPAAYQMYLDLGRFRNALVLDEQRRHPSARLSEFIGNCGLGGYRVQLDAVPSP